MKTQILIILLISVIIAMAECKSGSRATFSKNIPKTNQIKKTDSMIKMRFVDSKQDEGAEDGEEEEEEEDDPNAFRAGIEIEESEYPIARCSQLVGVDGEFVEHLDNFRQMYPGHLTFNIYNVNVFAAAEDPTSLVTSIDWKHVKWPAKQIEGLPGCVLIQSDWENKHILFCLPLENAAQVEVILLTFEQFKGCREGRRPEGIFGAGGDCSSSDSDSDDDGSKGGDACHGKGCDHDSPRHPIRPPHRFKQIIKNVRRFLRK